jgi:hypothetical protein
VCSNVSGLFQFVIVLYSHIRSICNVCTLQQRIIRIMSGVGATNSNRNLFKKSYIVPLWCLYILPLMMSVLDNQNNFQINLSVHGLDIRSKNQLYLPFANLSCFQRGVSYSSLIFNVVPNNIKNVRNDRVQFKIVLRKYGPSH